MLIVVAHPDDETIGLGGQLPRLRDVQILHVTDGAPRDGKDAAAHGFADWRGYATARRRELAAALRLAGIDAARSRCLDVADQQVVYALPSVIDGVAAILREVRPAVVFTHAYEGGHPDHDATALAVHAALAGAAVPALLIEMTGYHAGPLGIEAGIFLPTAGTEPVPKPVPLRLAAPELALKRRMLACFATQSDTLSSLPATDTEWLRPAPRYDFRQAPHPGTLFYERFDWGVTGATFRALGARVA